MQFDPEITSVNFSLAKIRNDLQLPLINCQIRGLVNSCSWIAELLLSIQQTLSKSDSSVPSTSPGSLMAVQYDGLSLENFSTYNLAKCYFDNKDFLRCSHLLSSLAGSHPLIDFLFFYSRYMAIEKRGTDEAITNKEDSSRQPVFPYPSDNYRKSLFELKTDIERRYGAEEVIQGTSLNAFLSSSVDVYTAYVLALVHIRLGCQKSALKILSHIVKKDSLLWPAWFEMSKLFEDRENFDRAFPPVTTVDNGNWMRAIFRAKALLNFQDTERALAILTCLSNGGFHNSLNLQADIADAHEKLRDHDISATIYKNIFTVDPYRLTDADIYSNVLFVKADHEELAFLARRCSEIDKYRPETCCVLGNFYGLRGQHDKAVLYFQRALRLQPRYVLVWILLGHEYVEMQHLQLAIYAYNQAIMHNRYDHRGWYGLGQLYEFIKQPQHALYYYKNSTFATNISIETIVLVLRKIDLAELCVYVCGFRNFIYNVNELDIQVLGLEKRFFILSGYYYLALINLSGCCRFKAASEGSNRTMIATSPANSKVLFTKLMVLRNVFENGFLRAQYLCPSDSRVIVALGDMYEQQNNVECAKMCFWRAYCVGDVEGTALFSLARCYEKSGNDCEAAAAYTQFIRQCEARGVSNESDLGQAYRFLANYHFRYGHHSDAVVAINKCLDFPEIREEAKALCLQVTLISGSGSGTLSDATHQVLPPAMPSTPDTKRNTTVDLLADRPIVRARRRLQGSDFTTNAESKMVLSQEMKPVITEKYLPFQLSRARFASVFGPQLEPLVITGSAQEEFNSLCVWQYNQYTNYGSNFKGSETTDVEVPTPLSDSSDEPRLVCSAVHAGSVTQLKPRADSRLIFTGSSMGFVGMYSLSLPETEQDVFRLHEVGYWSRAPSNPADELRRVDVPISDVAVSSDASQVFAANDNGELFVLDTETLAVKQQLIMSGLGHDLSTINALEPLDPSCLVSANQLGQLNIWDLRDRHTSTIPSKKIVPSGEPIPLLCLSQHPGQSHLLAVGGVANNYSSGDQSMATTTSYIWDLREERHPLSEIACRGGTVWEIGFHSHQPQYLFLATEEAGLMRIHSPTSTADSSWSFQQISQKLTSACVTSNPTPYCSVNTYDLAGDLIVCGRDKCTLQTVKDSAFSMGSSHSSPETRKLKCFPAIRTLPETSMNAEPFPENHTVVNGTASEVNSSHSPSNSVEAGGSFVKKNKGRCWLHKIAKPSSFHSGRQWYQSGNSNETEEFDKSVLNTSRQKSLSNTKSPQQLNHVLSSDSDLPVFSPVPEEKEFDGSPTLSSSVVQSAKQSRNIGRLSLLSPNGTYPLRLRSESSVSRNQYRRRNRMSKLPDFLSLDSDVAHETPMTCTLLHYSSANGNNKEFPFLPEGTAYLLSDEQHRSVEQTLCSTKLLLHRLKRVLIEV
ncbi:unnamed protein product [Rodentolepis nana]|uniref:ANAPC8 domain-containing protein n=1 Tax=Rodentolepis nana TaxID=102285 RepID=A0A0R3T3V4_RODNA|nr:unnamed protein product [Rodentolepis nana]